MTLKRFEPDPAILERLAKLEPRAWSGTVWRHTLGKNPPDKTNTRGARWNPPDVEALYTSMDRSTAVAEGDHLLEIQPLPPTTTRTVHRLEVELKSMLDLSDPAVLASLGVDQAALAEDDHSRCQAVGGAAWFLHFDGIVVPSARSPGHNLVILFEGSESLPRVRVLDSEVL
ncbi:MAG: RES family NAD+ phosphorylase [Candidatus Limnocylindrales bacterium]